MLSIVSILTSSFASYITVEDQSLLFSVLMVAKGSVLNYFFLTQGSMPTVNANSQISQEDTDGTTIIDSFITDNRVIRETRNFKCQSKLIKWIGALFLLFVSTTVPGIIILSEDKPHHSAVLSYNVEIQQNETACVFIKQYDIYHDTYVTVCNRYGIVELDIRKFVNDTASIKGIQLSERQWLRLKQVSSRIDTAIAEARTYWKDLKILKYRTTPSTDLG